MYDLNRLGSAEFEHLVQSILKKVVGAGTITFGAGPDGGREATFSGKAPYPSVKQNWTGEWIFQAKFHDIQRIGADEGRKQLLNDLDKELEKITGRHGYNCQNYILASNVPLSSVAEKGTHDKIQYDIIPKYTKKIKNIHVWGYDEICRFLDQFADIRKAYLHFVTPGDLIARLMDSAGSQEEEVRTIRAYLISSFNREKYVGLDQAGGTENPVHIRVFVDLDAQVKSESVWSGNLFRSEHWQASVSNVSESILDRVMAYQNEPLTLGSFDFVEYVDTKLDDSFLQVYEHARIQEQARYVSATQLLLSGNHPRAIVIGGPGQGKSTLMQFIGQIHRATILGKLEELRYEDKELVPSIPRLPLKVILKDYAQWITETKGSPAVEEFLAMKISEYAGKQLSAAKVQDMMKYNPTLIIFDGLDEVNIPHIRKRMLELIDEFLKRGEEVLGSDMQILATSRPYGIPDEFVSERFTQLTLAPMSQKKVLEYVTRWTKVRDMESSRASSLHDSIRESLSDPYFSSLMTTPLQVTIFMLIILNGGSPPRQREELFEEYLEVIYKREKSKSKTILVTEKRELFGLHQFIGYILHKRAAESNNVNSLIDEDEFGKEVLRYLYRNDPFSPPEELKARAAQMIEEARNRLVLLVEPRQGFFGFELRSIQEFFAAGYLADSAKNNEQRFTRFRAIALQSHWRNVALFFAGRVGRAYRGEAAQLLEECRELDRDPAKPEYVLRSGAKLALEIALDRSFGPNKILHRSAIELALSLIYAKLGGWTQKEYLKQIKSFPREDIQQHLIPILTQDSERAVRSESTLVLWILSKLSSEAPLLEEYMQKDLVHNGPNISKLQFALILPVSADFVSRQFGQLISTLDDETLVRIFFFESVTNPERVYEILRTAKRTALMYKLLTAGTEYRFLYNIVSIPKNTVVPKESDFDNEELIGFLLLRLVGAARINERDRKSIYFNKETARDVQKLISNTSVNPYVRAIGIVYLLTARDEEGTVVSRELSSVLAGLHESPELVDMILFNLHLPKIMTERDYTKIMERVISQSGVDTPDIVKHFVMESLPSSLTSEVLTGRKSISTNTLDVEDITHFKESVLKAMRDSVGHLWPSTEKLGLSQDFVKDILDQLVQLPRDRQFEWRLFEIILRLSQFNVDLKPTFPGQRGNSIDKTILSSRIANLVGRLEQSGFKDRLVELTSLLSWSISFADLTTLRMLMNLIGLANLPAKGVTTYPIPRLHDAIDFKDLLAHSSKEDFLNFLKWIACAYEYGSLPSKRLVSYRETGSKVLSVIANLDDVRFEGAVLLLTDYYRQNEPEEDVICKILEQSNVHALEIEVWRNFLEGVFFERNLETVTKFLEKIVKSGPKYHLNLAMAAAQLIARYTPAPSPNIAALETSLGLPFQEHPE